MPQRFLRPGITNSERWNAVSFEAQSLFVRILTLVDDFGRYDARIAILHGQCFALRNDVKPQRTAAMRSELHNAGMIDVYEVGGREYLQVAQWQERARCPKSKFPDKPQVVDISTPAADGSEPQPIPASIVPISSTIDHRPSTIGPAAGAAKSERGRGSLEDVKEFCAEEKIPESDAVWFFHKCEGNGWTNSGKPIRDWRATIRAWRAANYLPSQKSPKNGIKPTETFTLKKDNIPVFDPLKDE